MSCGASSPIGVSAPHPRRTGLRRRRTTGVPRQAPGVATAVGHAAGAMRYRRRRDAPQPRPVPSAPPPSSASSSCSSPPAWPLRRRPGPTAIAPSAAEAPERQVALGVSIWNGAPSTLRARHLPPSVRCAGTGPPPRPSGASGATRPRGFPTSQARAVRARGVTPISWGGGRSKCDLESPVYARHANIAEGRHDEYVLLIPTVGTGIPGPPSSCVSRMSPMGGHSHGASAGSTTKPRPSWRRGGTCTTCSRRKVRRTSGSSGAVGRKACPRGCDPYSEFYPGDAYVDYLGSALQLGRVPATSGCRCSRASGE